jgi:predicted alpha/beta-hydrolase family hydrolase
MVLTHGAGSNCAAPLLVAVATAFCDAGITVLRCDLPFRQRRPSGPPSPSTAEADRAGLRAAVAALREIIKGPVILAGHSYGGRQASMLAADVPDVAAALLLLSIRFIHWPSLRSCARSISHGYVSRRFRSRHR